MNLSIPCSVSKTICPEQIYRFEVFKHIHLISEAVWNKFARTHFSSYDFLSFLEEITQPEIKFRYVLIRKEQEICGVAVFQLITFDGAQLINYFPEKAESKPWGRLLKSFIQKITSRIRVPLLVSGNVFMTGENGFYPPADLSQEERAELFHHISQFILDKDRSIKAVLIPDLYDKDKEFSEALLQKQFRLLQEEPDMEICLKQDWNSFEDYLSSFSSKYRVRCKKALSSSAPLVCKNLSSTEIREQTTEIYTLYKQVMDRVDFKLASLPASYFAAQKAAEPEKYQLWAYFHNNKMIGFISAFRQESAIEIHYCGIDHEVNKVLCLYQRMLYDMVRFGIETASSRLHFGRTAQEIKSTIGARPMFTHGLLRHRNLLINFVMKWITSILRSREFVFRSPFKEQEAEV